MKAPTVDYTEEKIAMAEKLGLPYCADAMKAAKAEVEQRRLEVVALTNLKFKPIEISKIRRMLSGRMHKPFYHQGDAQFFCMILLAILGISLLLTTLTGKFHYDRADYIIMGCVLGIAGLAYASCSFPKYKAEFMPLVNWRDPLPRGALLALQEAVDAGIGRFRIYYPKFEEKRVKSDPVIVGYKDGIKSALMIHAWDDGKVHE